MRSARTTPLRTSRTRSCELKNVCERSPRQRSIHLKSSDARSAEKAESRKAERAVNEECFEVIIAARGKIADLEGIRKVESDEGTLAESAAKSLSVGGTMPGQSMRKIFFVRDTYCQTFVSPGMGAALHTCAARTETSCASRAIQPRNQ